MQQVKISDCNKQVQVTDGKLFFGTREVQGCEFIKPETIAKQYVVRVKETYPLRGEEVTTMRLVTGFDLVDDKFWIGGCSLRMWVNQEQQYLPPAHFDNFESVERVLNTLCDKTAGKEWAIFEEEDFEAYQQEMWDQDEWYANNTEVN